MVDNYDITCKKVTPLVQGRYFCQNCTVTYKGETISGFNMILETGNNTLEPKEKKETEE